MSKTRLNINIPLKLENRILEFALHFGINKTTACIILFDYALNSHETMLKKKN